MGWNFWIPLGCCLLPVKFLHSNPKTYGRLFLPGIFFQWRIAFPNLLLSIEKTCSVCCEPCEGPLLLWLITGVTILTASSFVQWGCPFHDWTGQDVHQTMVGHRLTIVRFFVDGIRHVFASSFCHLHKFFQFKIAPPVEPFSKFHRFWKQALQVEPIRWNWSRIYEIGFTGNAYANMPYR